MKSINFWLFILSLGTLVQTTESCKKDDSCTIVNCNTGTQNPETCACDCLSGFSGVNCLTEDLCITGNVSCQNGGTCVNGTCDCIPGYTGINCELDTAQIQILLDAGTSPKSLYHNGVPLDHLYGKSYQGGLIFYLDTIDGSGMVAATENQSTGADWACYEIDLMDINNALNNSTNPETTEGARIGDGKANTDAIVASCLTTGNAAQLCRNIGPAWFLPSRGELNLMFTNLKERGIGGFAPDFYWSSSEQGANFAWLQNMVVGEQVFGNKESLLYVRAARAFN